MRIHDVLVEYGLTLSPMVSAPRDGRPIVAFSAYEGPQIYQWIEAPTELAGPAWIKPGSTRRGYLDRYFLGWLYLSHLRPIDKNGLRRLLIAYIDESRSEGDPLNVLSDVPDRVNANDR